MDNKKQKLFKKMLNLCIFTVFFLILVGGLVRSTGSGLGCPDWPTCFGKLIPPTDISQLPLDYKDQFKVAGKIIADFSPIKTWTEYINRLVGATTGIFVIILAFFSHSYWQENKKVTILSWASVFAVGFNGWLGAVVVASHLKPFIITLHMLMAVVTIFILLQAKIESANDQLSAYLDQNIGKSMKKLIIFIIFLSAVQIVLGTQVREEIDHISHSLGAMARETWIGKLGVVFLVHRSFSLLLVVTSFILFRNCRSLKPQHSLIKGWVNICLFLLGINIVSGVTLSYGGFPAAVQPPHLLFGLMLVSAQYYLLSIVSKSSTLEV
ncbi:heme A synthase [Halobacteriovorax sp. HLS]|uniref:COX15/CtaA family protein n=1 Tax=Halobacteriovorax sp. HLS TaxID=2234000 RepID=UPI000FD9286B|nr:COX15/CtaA family protein [Halobacteriovorax sp. HLS]